MTAMFERLVADRLEFDAIDAERCGIGSKRLGELSNVRVGRTEGVQQRPAHSGRLAMVRVTCAKTAVMERHDPTVNAHPPMVGCLKEALDRRASREL